MAVCDNVLATQPSRVPTSNAGSDGPWFREVSYTQWGRPFVARQPLTRSMLPPPAGANHYQPPNLHPEYMGGVTVNAAPYGSTM